MKEFILNENDAGQRLDRFAGKAAPMLPEALLQKYIRTKRIKVNGKGGKRDLRLRAGDAVQMYINDEFFQRPTEENGWRKVNAPRVSVVYEDGNILLADKPAGVLCHAGEDGEWNTLLSHIRAYLYKKGEWDPDAENSFSPALCNRCQKKGNLLDYFLLPSGFPLTFNQGISAAQRRRYSKIKAARRRLLFWSR